MVCAFGDFFDLLRTGAGAFGKRPQMLRYLLAKNVNFYNFIRFPQKTTKRISALHGGLGHGLEVFGLFEFWWGFECDFNFLLIFNF